jgi:chorismate synthase
MASIFGHRFRVATFGESHGPVVGAVVEGCPAGLALDVDAIQAELDRRRPGQSALTSPRKEPDRVEVLSGVFEGTTLGTPILLLVRNVDARSADYAAQKDLWRPSHADFTYDAKYGVRDWRGGGRASARETVGRVLGGAVARQVLATAGVEIVAWVDRVADVEAHVDPETVSRAAVESHATRCPDAAAAEAMARCI